MLWRRGQLTLCSAWRAKAVSGWRRRLSMSETPPPRASVTLFLSGDVMIGRGIDQILPDPNDPRLFEPCMRSAVEYVQLAERVSGPISDRKSVVLGKSV